MNFLKNLFKRHSTSSIKAESITKILKEINPNKIFKCSCCKSVSTSFVDVATKNKIPLKFLSYEIEIVDSLAYICLNQEYFNDSPNKIETEFYFSIGNNTCFYDFEATINNIVIKGQIKEKQKAKEEYKKNLEKGNMVAYSELNNDSPDVLKINVGNIPPKTFVSIKFKYLQELEICMNKFWRLTIPSTLNPKYHSRHQATQDPDIKNLENLNQIKPSNQEAYKWSIKTSISSSSPISFLKSPSHEVKTEFQDKTQNKCVITFQNEEIPNKDFTILYKNEEIDKSHWILEHKEGDEEYPYCSMFSFFPKFNNSSDNDAYEAFMKNSVKNSYKISALKSKGEFIFVLDRSGSMSGKRIEMAKEALILFLKSMPPDSFFNVLSFGSQFSLLFKEKQKYSEETIKKAILEIQSFSADMGGTEIYDPLENVFAQTLEKNYPKNVFILTDGEVSNTNQILSLINKNKEGSRTYTIGIGNGCSRDLIVKGAIAGNGKYEFIADGEDMNSKIIGLLEDSLTPFLTDIKIEFNKDLVEIITPLPENIAFIRKNEPLRFFAFFNKKFEKIGEISFKLSYISSLKNERQVEEIQIKKSDLDLKEDYLHKYGIFNLLGLFIRNFIYERDINNDIYLAKKTDMEAFSLSLALKYQILTLFTAFICLIKERNPHDQSKFSIKKEIPSIESSDYQENEVKDDIYIPMMWSGSTNQKKSLNFLSKKSENLALKSKTFSSKSMCRRVSKDMTFSSEKKCEPICFSLGKSLKCDLKSEIKEKDEEKTYSAIKEKKEAKTDKEDKEILMKILGMQKLGGYWEVESNILNLLGIDDEQLFKIQPKEIQRNEIWLTIFILAYLGLKFAKNEGSWKLISQKAIEYLEDNGVNYENYKEKVIIFVK